MPRPIAPFHIAGNLYYVGSKDLASYLIVTPQGDILINSSFATSPPLLRAAVEQLGFQFKDIKILLISHSHADHDAGSAEIIKQTGAKYMVMDGDVPVVESGGAQDFAYPTSLYPPTKVDRVLHDGDEVRIGDAVLVAHKTARRTFITLKGLPCDIFLGAHGGYFDMLGKLNQIKAGAKGNVWVDAKGYQVAVAERQGAFEAELKRQEAQ
jgi:metallo-beta-lactamase class B